MEQSILYENLIDEYIEQRLHDKSVETNDIENDVQEENQQENHEENQECIVCFEPFDESISKMKKYEFNHCVRVNLHTKCFIQWVSENNNSCIVCRERITDGPEYCNISLIMQLNSYIQHQTRLEVIRLRESQPINVLCRSRRVAFIAIFVALVLIATLPLYK